MKISRNTPKIIDELYDQVKSYKCLLWFGIFLNLVFPLMEGVGFIIDSHAAKAGNQQNETIGAMIENFAASGHGLLWIFTACLMVSSIMSIRNYLKSRDDDGKALNLKTLMLHSSAFGFFAIAMILNEAAIIYWFIASSLEDKHSGD